MSRRLTYRPRFAAADDRSPHSVEEVLDDEERERLDEARDDDDHPDEEGADNEDEA